MQIVRRVVLDTNVLVSAFRSRRGASFYLLSHVGSGLFEVAVSVPLVLEYEDALIRSLPETGLTVEDVQAVIDYICSVAIRQDIFFLWRPALRDPGDELVLEIAVAADCEAIVTHNVRDFDRASSFGLRVLTPGLLVRELRGIK